MGDGRWGMAAIPHPPSPIPYPRLCQQLLEPGRVELSQAFARGLAHLPPERRGLGKLLAGRECLSVHKHFEQVMEMRSARNPLPAFPFENAAPADANQLTQLGLGESSLVAERHQSLADRM